MFIFCYQNETKCHVVVLMTSAVTVQIVYVIKKRRYFMAPEVQRTACLSCGPIQGFALTSYLLV